MSEQQVPSSSQASQVQMGSRFLLTWADPVRRAEVFKLLEVLGRQTMNLRLMLTARILTLVDIERNLLVGFCGFDDEYAPRFPELFSLHLDEAYRSFKLGLLLQTARAQCLLSRGHTIAYTRMDVSANAALLASRTSSTIFTRLAPEELDEHYTGLCRQCELYGKTCLNQAFLQVDLKALANRGSERLSGLDYTDLPILVELSESNVSKVG